MHVLTIGGSPSTRSRSNALLRLVSRQLQTLSLETGHVGAADLPADDLLLARFDSPAVKRFQDGVVRASGLIIATPVYKASFSGALKVLLDLLPEGALVGKTVLPLATGGSPLHTLAVEHALQPVLSALKAHHVLPCVFAVDQDVRWVGEHEVVLSPGLETRLTLAVDRFAANLPDLGQRTPDPAQLARSVAAARLAI